MMTKDKGDEEETPSHYILHVNVYLFSTWRNFEGVDDDLFLQNWLDRFGLVSWNP